MKEICDDEGNESVAEIGRRGASDPGDRGLECDVVKRVSFCLYAMENAMGVEAIVTADARENDGNDPEIGCDSDGTSSYLRFFYPLWPT